MSQAILFLNGKIDIDFCQNYIKKQNLDLPVFCADGAYSKIKDNVFLSQNIKKVIGDFDSARKVTDSDLFLVIKDQDTTDFEKNLDHLLDNDFTKIYVFGASEGEMDHFLCNVSTAKKYKEKLELEFIDIYSRYFFIPKRFKINNVIGKMFSIMPFTYAEDIYFKGLKYPLNGENLYLDLRTGARNHAVADDVEISYSKGDILLFISHAKYEDRLNDIS